MKSEQRAIRTICYSMLSNLLLATIKFIAGVLGSSFALIADAIESLSDMISEVIVFLGLKYASKPADANHPYGHGKIEPLVTFVVVAFLIAAASTIIYQAIVNIYTPHDPPKPWTLIILAVIIGWKEISYRWVMHNSQLTNSTSLRAAAWHHRSDAMSSFAALLGILIAVILGDQYASADDWAALVAALVILVNAYLIFRPALGEIMDEHVYDEFIEQVRHHATSVEGVITTEKCYVRKSGMTFFVDLHVIVSGDITVREGHRIAHALKDYLMQQIPEIADVLIHVEPEDVLESACCE